LGLGGGGGGWWLFSEGIKRHHEIEKEAVVQLTARRSRGRRES